MLSRLGRPRRGASSLAGAASALRVATWNIAAINNNPFEYWITYDNSPVYQSLMSKLQHVIERPTTWDVPVQEVFSPKMFQALMAGMSEAGMDSLDRVEHTWNSEFKHRSIISEFLKDPLLGKKRLASMPDRLTNTIALADGRLGYRPTVINCYEGDLSTQELWYDKWHEFFFKESIHLAGDQEHIKGAHSVLTPILHSKYPALSPEEEEISIPLQLMCQGIFDAILVHLMNSLAPGEWQPMKKDMCRNLNHKKVPRTLEILEQNYSENHVVFLQEVSSDFVRNIQSSRLSEAYHMVLPAKIDMKRDQNSVILLNKQRFGGEAREMTSVVEATLKQDLKPGMKSPMANGDLLTVEAEDLNGQKYVLSSFHGDTNGLASLPVLSAVHKAIARHRDTHHFVFGLDANTYENTHGSERQGVAHFAQEFTAKGMGSCWGSHPDPARHTTCNARTFLQPQLNKACAAPQAGDDGIIREFPEKADVNLKDYVLFYTDQLRATETIRDNTGRREYLEGMFFPTLSFPSDHGIIETVLQPVSQSKY